MQRLYDLAAAVEPTEPSAADRARAHHLTLTKPPGSLGRLEALGVQLSAISGSVPPPAPRPGVVAVFAADHGVHAEGVTPWPQEVTAQMVANFCGGGAAINAIASTNGLQLAVVNAGVSVPVDNHPLLTNTPIRPGTANLAQGPAMSHDEAVAAVALGAEIAERHLNAGAACLITGDMGIANTTASAAIIAAVTGRSAPAMTGRGTGIDDAMLAHKTAVIAGALARASTRLGELGVGPDASAPATAEAAVEAGVGLQAEIGGLEIAALAGFCLGGARGRVPVIVDGVIALAGAVTASVIQPAVGDYLVAGHLSVEPAAAAAVEHLGLDPLLDLGCRLGEGSGAALAYPLVRAAAQIMTSMATFDAAAIDGPSD